MVGPSLWNDTLLAPRSVMLQGISSASLRSLKTSFHQPVTLRPLNSLLREALYKYPNNITYRTRLLHVRHVPLYTTTTEITIATITVAVTNPTITIATTKNNRMSIIKNCITITMFILLLLLVFLPGLRPGS